MPGSPVCQAEPTMVSNTCRASSRPVTCFVAGSTSSYVLPASTASMKASVMPTEMLKLVISVRLFLQVMNSMMSGWSTRSMPILAPRRVPPCFTASVAALKTFMKEMGPEATPPVEFTVEPLARRREKEKPVPPPDLWISAAFLMASKISSMESATGSTKQAESWPRGRPAFIRVGELGKNSRLVIRL